MKKIAIITDSVLHGGVARVALTLLDIFLNKNINCVVYTVLDNSNEERLGNIFINSGNKKYIPRLFEISTEINKGKFTHVLVLTTGKLSVFFAPFLIKPKYKNIVCEHISFESYSLALQILKKITYKFYHNIVVLTLHDHRLLAKKRERVIRIHNPCPFKGDCFRKTDNNKRYLAVGHLIPRKGYSRLLDIWERYTTSGGQGTLSIVGDGPLKNELLTKINNQNIRNVVLFGNQENMESIYKCHDVLLCSAFAEGLPMTFIEAQHFSLPVISYDIKTGPSEIIVNGVNGYLVDNYDTHSFLASMFRIEDDKIYKELAMNSAESSKKFSTDVIFEQWSSIIDG